MLSRASRCFASYPAGYLNLISSMKGFYHARMAPRCYPDGFAAEEHLRKSANFYLEAAEKFPEDDEKHACESLAKSLTSYLNIKSAHLLVYLNCAVENFFMSGTEARVTLELLKRIRIALPKMNKIWGESAMAKQGREQIFARTLETEKELLAGVAAGQFTLSDKPMPQVSIFYLPVNLILMLSLVGVHEVCAPTRARAEIKPLPTAKVIILGRLPYPSLSTVDLQHSFLVQHISLEI